MPTRLALIKRILDSEAGRRQPASVLLRVARWQWRRHGLRRPMTFATVTGARLALLPGASHSLSGFWYQQLPDFDELVFALHLLRPGDLFVDVGANQGGWTLTMAGHGASVIAFEPVPLTRERLLDNVDRNPAEIRRRIRVLATGLSDQTGQASFTTDLDAGNHHVRDQAGMSQDLITVELARADEILRDTSPVLIKIDVEGEELAVLKGARTILAKPGLVALVMETFRPHNYAQASLIAAECILREHGFRPMAYDPWRRELWPLVKPADGGQNTIYVRDQARVSAHLRAAGHIRVFGEEV